MAIFSLEDAKDSLRCTMFPKNYEANREKLAEGKAAVLRGKLKNDGDSIEINVNEVRDPCKIYVRVASANEEVLLARLQSILGGCPGFVPVEVYYADTKKYMPFPNIGGVGLDNKMLDAIRAEIGAANVAVQ